MSQVQKSSRVVVVVDAPVSLVWEVISDVTRIGEWSHECQGGKWLDGVDAPALGARFRAGNRAGWARWTRTSEITTFDPPHELAWRTVPTLRFPDSTQWCIQLQPSDGRTVITQSFSVLRTPPRLLDRLYAWLIPTHRDRDERLAEDLARAGAVARRGTRA